MEAPATGPVTASVPNTPSSFEGAMAARASAAESTGGLFQPTASGTAPPSQGGQAPVDKATLADFQDGEHFEATAPDAPVEEPLAQDEVPLEQLYDEQGNPIDMQAYTAQRKQVLQSIQQSIEEGKLPFDVLKDLPLTVKVNGEEREVPLEEVRDGYQRRADYTRKLQEVQQMQMQAQHILQLERARNAEWRDPKQLRQGLRMLGLEESFMKAAFGWAEERVHYMKLPPTERALIDRLQHYEMQTQQMQAQQRQQELLMRQQQQVQRGPDPATQHVAKQLEQLMPRTLRQHGIGTYPLAQQTFLQQLEHFCPDGQVTPERANDAAIATKEFLQDLAKANANQLKGMPAQLPANAAQGGGAPQPQPGYPLAPRRLSTGPSPQQQRPMLLGNVGGGSNGQRGGRRPSDFRSKFGLG